MADVTKETITTRNDGEERVLNNQERRSATGSQTVEYLIYFLFGVLEIILAFRLVLKLMGASLGSGFVNAIYDISAIFIRPFSGIFRSGVTEGVETASVFEPGTLIAIIVYAFLAWGIVSLIQIFAGRRPE